MEKRDNKRLKVQLNAEIDSGGKRHEGLVDNLSERGVCITTSPTVSAKDFIPGTLPEVKLKLNSGETIDLHCEVRWLHSFILQTSSVVNTLGMQIVNPHLEYLEYFKTLQ
jgi:hypothetical protein